jgi:hypothetical protein
MFVNKGRALQYLNPLSIENNESEDKANSERGY